MRFILICTTFLVVQMAVLGLGLIATDAVNIARAYVGGESLYSQGQKSAVISLHRYVVSGDEADYGDFIAAIQRPLGDLKARQALEQDQPDIDAAKEGLVQGGIDPADINGIIRFFLWFKDTDYLRETLIDWREADRQILNLSRLGKLVHDLSKLEAALPAEGLSPRRPELRAQMQRTLQTVDQIDRSLTEIEENFATHIGATARFAGHAVAMILIGASLILWLIGGAVIWRMYRRNVVADRDLEQSEERFRAFAEIASDWFWEMDADLKFSYISGRAAELFGLPVAAMLHRSREDLAAAKQDDPSWQAHLATLKAHEPFRDFRYLFNLPNGRYCHVSVSGKPIFDLQGNFRGYRGTGIDVTKETETIDNLRIAKELAEVANRTKTTFLANMSHELRTPLNAILGFSEVIRDQLFGALDNTRYLEYARSINDAGRHLLRLINDLLDISRIESGRMELHDAVIDLRDVIKSCELLVRETARTSSLALSVEIDPAIGRIKADERKLKQALLNLIGNALKFTRAGGRVAVKATILLTGDVAIAVSDTGIGIKSIDIPKALTPFMQVDGGLDRRHEGSGLGLPLTKALVELHQGRLEIMSEIDRGTTVTIVLPAERHLPSANAPISFDAVRQQQQAGNKRR